MSLSDYQQTIFLDRYSKRNEENEPSEQHIEQLWTRVAEEIATNEVEREQFYGILEDFHFVPGGRILAGAGTESEKTYYNCFVIPVETAARRRSRSSAAKLMPSWVDTDTGSDSRKAIFDTIATMVDIMSRGGGVGVNWSVLRPSGAYLTRISGTSSGPIGWMDVASKAVGEVIQGGSRRGAAMFMLNDWHPDVEAFIEAKTEAGRIENANISVAVSDALMAAARENKTWQFRFPDTTHPAYNTEWDGDLDAWVEKGYPVKVHGRISARVLYEKLATAAWKSGEPGVVFIERYNNLSTAHGVEDIISVNPCGEQGLGAYSVCNLGSMNLAAYVVEGHFDWHRFRQDVAVAIRFLDNVIDKTHYMHEDTKRVQEKLRRVGLGVMGLADTLIMLGMRYGSSKAVEFTEHVFSDMKDTAIKTSMGLAAERGPAGAWSDSMWDRPYLAEFAKRHKGYNLTPLRNLFLLTQAPTGTTAALAGVNSGIEPYFNFKFTRVDRTGTHEPVTAIQRQWQDAKDAGVELGSEWVTSQQVTVKEHLVMQAAVQKWIDSSVSKTINAPNDQPVEETIEAYTMAYDLGLKGLAYYRDGSRSKQVLYHEDPNKKIAELEAKIAFLQRTQQPQPYSAHPGLDMATPTMLVFDTSNDDKCPVDGGDVIFAEGCRKCSTCSWSAC